MDHPKVSAQLRRMIESDPLSLNAIARASGVDKSILSRFLHGSQLRSDNLDALAEYYGVRLTRPKKRGG